MTHDRAEQAFRSALATRAEEFEPRASPSPSLPAGGAGPRSWRSPRWS